MIAECEPKGLGSPVKREGTQHIAMIPSCLTFEMTPELCSAVKAEYERLGITLTEEEFLRILMAL